MRLLLLLVILTVVPHAFAVAGDVRPVQRFGLFVGANEGLPSQPRLRWAVTDAKKMASIMVEAGGIRRENATVMGQPSGSDLLGTIRAMRAVFLKAKSSGQKPEFYFYYSGHSDERGLLLGADRVSYADLRKAITNTEAEVNVAILDSCDSGSFTRTKGGERVQPFLTDLSSETTGYAFLTSSSVSEASQESDQLGGSFFTYYFINGLRGAADTTGTKRVTLNQAYQYAFRETLAQTEGTAAGAQHASYDFQLKGSGDLVIVDLTKHRSSILLEAGLGGRLYIRDESGTLVSELQKEDGKPLTIAIPSGSYTIRYRRDASVFTAKVTVTEENQAVLTSGQFAAEAAQTNRSRGDDPVRKVNPFDLQAIPRTDTPPAEDTAVSLGVFGARVDTVRGLQASSIVSIAEESAGAQLAGVITAAGPVEGVQAAGVAAVAGQVTDVQLAGVYAQADDLAGWQAAGVISVAQDVVGLQSSGVLSVAQSVDGMQTGVVNVATKVRGFQLGVVNVADDVEGVSLGLVSWITNGIHEISGGYDLGNNGTFVRWTGGSRTFWTSVEFGVQNQQTRVSGGEAVRGLWFDTALGVRMEEEKLGLDLGLGLRQLSSPETDQASALRSIWAHENEINMVPHLDASLRYRLFERLVLWSGPRLDLVDSRLMDLDRYRGGNSLKLLDLAPGTTSVWLGFSSGLTFQF